MHDAELINKIKYVKNLEYRRSPFRYFSEKDRTDIPTTAITKRRNNEKKIFHHIFSLESTQIHTSLKIKLPISLKRN